MEKSPDQQAHPTGDGTSDSGVNTVVLSAKGAAKKALAKAESATTVAERHPSRESGERPERRERPELPAGTIVGRYVVLDRIATGGMGAVYRAFDPELDRKVAVKVVAIAHDQDDEAATAAARLVREARALAQLSHPNVVAIYDVGRYEDDVFIAMALVEGQTLRAWKKAQKRSIAEIVEVLVGAGRGLAAAHHAGLVHRDFKPDNVLVGDDGRVQVVDFGIAQSEAPVPDDSLTRSLSTSSGSHESTFSSMERLTIIGTLVGTPGYMSPEQCLGESTDAKSDQFSFCVALYECLFDKRPFAGSTPAELKRSVTAGKLREPPADSRVPQRLRKIIFRGLSHLPEDRYESMEELLDQLSKDPPAAMKRAGLLLAALALIGAASVAVARVGAAESTLCKSTTEELAGHWDRPVRLDAQAKFVATGKPYAAEAFRRVEGVMNNYAERWVATRTTTCKATHIAGTQSEQMLDLRMRCLDQRLDALSSLAKVFTDKLDVATVDKALPAALGLPELRDCDDDEALTAAVPPPTDPAVRANVDALRTRLAAARALQTTGRYSDGLEIINEVSSAVNDTNYAPVRAEMQLIEGLLRFGSGEFEASEEALRAAVVAGAEARDDVLIAEAWIHMLQTVEKQANYDTGLELALTAEVAVARAGKLERQLGELQYSIGGLYYGKGEYDTAIEHQQRALELLESALGPDHPQVASALRGLAAIHYRQAHYPQALALCERALDIYERAYGDEHPVYGVAVYSVAVLYAGIPDYERAEALFKRALEILKKAYGTDHDAVAAAFYGLGTLYYDIGRYREAEKLLRLSLKVHEKVLGSDHPLTGYSAVSLGATLNAVEKYDRAESFLARGLEIWESRLGSDHPILAYALEEIASGYAHRGHFNKAEPLYLRALKVRSDRLGDDHDEVGRSHQFLGLGLANVGRHREAIPHLERALAIYGKSLGADNPRVVAALSGLANSYLAIGKPDRAREVLERALTIHDKHKLRDQHLVAQLNFSMARALWDELEERPRALTLATSARELVAADKRLPSARLLADVDRWLKSRGASAAR